MSTKAPTPASAPTNFALPHHKITPRIEAVARAICKAKGIDPDYKGSPYPPGVPVWVFFADDADLFIEQYDALVKYDRP